MRRFGDLTDTDPRAAEVELALARQKSAREKIGLVFQLIELAYGAARSGIRRAHPDAPEDEERARLAALHLDRDTVMRVYGWDPKNETWCRGSF